MLNLRTRCRTSHHCRFLTLEQFLCPCFIRNCKQTFTAAQACLIWFEFCHFYQVLNLVVGLHCKEAQFSAVNQKDVNIRVEFTCCYFLVVEVYAASPGPLQMIKRVLLSTVHWILSFGPCIRITCWTLYPCEVKEIVWSIGNSLFAIHLSGLTPPNNDRLTDKEKNKYIYQLRRFETNYTVCIILAPQCQNCIFCTCSSLENFQQYKENVPVWFQWG